MRLLMLSTDELILSPGSAPAERMIDYGAQVERLDIILPTATGTTATGTTATRKLSPTTTVYSIAGNRVIYFWRAWRLLRQLIRTGDYDWLSAQDPFENGLLACLAVWKTRVKLQFQLHTDFLSPFFTRGSWRNRFRSLLATWLLPYATAVRVVSDRIKDSLLLRWPTLGGKITVLPIFVSPPLSSEESDLKQKFPSFSPLVVMASRLEPEKNFSLALSALARAIIHHQSAGLVIVGAGSEQKKIEALAARLGLSRRVAILPWTDNLPAILAAADLYLLSSNFEGYGRTLLEAALARLPIVTTDVGVAREVVRDGENGLIVPPGDERALAAALARVLSNLSAFQTAAATPPVIPTKEEYLARWRAAFLS